MEQYDLKFEFTKIICKDKNRIQLLTDMIFNNMKCFSVNFDSSGLIYNMKIKKTDFKKEYKDSIQREVITNILNKTFIDFINILLTEQSVSTEDRILLDSILENVPTNILYSIIIINGGDVSIKI